MFKRIIIELKGPICNCPEENLVWGINSIDNLFIVCGTCDARFDVGVGQFVASFRLDIPYPVKKLTSRLDIKDYPNVVEFKPR